MPAPTNLPIERKRGDTRRIVYAIKDVDKNAIDITLWTAFLLTVDPQKKPVDDTNNLYQVAGVLEGAGINGRVGFSPPGTTVVGSYFYDCQALDGNGEKVTFAEGKYKLTMDITKD